MADRIKGITIEIDGDTTGLSKALQSVNKSIRDSQTALKDVDRLLKLNPSSTELLSQKQQYLGEAVAATRSKLIDEMEAMDTLNERAKKGEDVSEQQNALKREIEATTQSLNDLTEKYKNFGSVGAQQVAVVGEKFKEVGGKITDVGTGLSKSVTAPILAVGAASVAAWKEVDSAMDVIVTKTGATGEALEDLQNRAENIATTIPTSFESAATAIGEVNTRFGLTGDELEKLSTQFIQFAEINGTDVNSSIDLVQKALSAFGLSAEDAGALLDTLNVVGQETGVDLNTLSSLLTSNATAFQGFGLNVADAAHLLGELEKSGIDTSVVMTGLSKVQVSAMKSGESMEASLTKALSSSESAIDVFGAKAGPKLYQAFQNGTLSAEMFTESQYQLSDAVGSVSGTYNETLDPLDQMTTIMNQLKAVGTDIVTTIGPGIASAMQKIADVVKAVNDGWNQLSDGQKKVALTVVGIVAAIGPLLVGVGKVIVLIGQVMTMMPMITGFMTATAIPAISGVIAAIVPMLPMIAAVVAAVVGAIAIGKLIVKNWDTIKKGAQALLSHIRTTFTNIYNSIKTNITNAWNAVKSAFQQIQTFVSTSVKNVQTGVANAFNAVKTTVTNVVNGVKTAVSTGFTAVSTTITNVLNAVKTNVTNSWNAIKTTVSTVVTAISSTISSVFNGIRSTVSSIVSGVSSAVSSAFNNIRSVVSSTLGGVSSTVSSIFNGVSSTISNVMNSARNVVSGAVNAIKGMFNFSLSIPNVATGALDTVKSLVSGAVSTIKSFFNFNWSLPSIGSGIIDTMKSTVRGAIDYVKGLFNFSWSLPDIKLPHFRINGGKWPYGLGGEGVFPSVSIAWYKKAYDNPVLFQNPTVLPTMSGMKGFGDGTGAELVIGMNKLKEMVGSTGNTINVNVYASPGMNETALANKVAAKLDHWLGKRL